MSGLVKRFRFIVEVDADPDEEELTREGRAPTAEVLRDEIRSNLESLRGVARIVVEQEP